MPHIGETYGHMRSRIPLFATKYMSHRFYVLRGKRSVGKVGWMSIYLSDGIFLLGGSGCGTGLFELGLHCGILVGEFLDGQCFCLVVGQAEIVF